MGGFLGGLGELLGGFNSARRIDKEGFDFREAQAQENFRRQREQELARQANEDRSLSQLGDVLAAQDQPDVEGAISSMPGQVDQARRGWMAKVALGQLPERKSRLEASKSYSRLAEQQLKGNQALEQIDLRGDEAESLTRLKADIEAGRKPSPRDEYIADQAAKRTGMTIDAMLKRASMGGGGAGRGTLIPLKDEFGRVMASFNNKTGEIVPLDTGGLRTTPLAAQAQEALALGTQGAGSISTIKNLLSKRPEGETWTGPTAATEYAVRAGQTPRPLAMLTEQLGVEPPTGERAIFASATGNLRNMGIKYITGAQMSEKEVPRLMEELPTMADPEPVYLKLAVTEARFDILDKVRRGELTKDAAVRQLNSIGPEQYLQGYHERGLRTGPSQHGPAVQRRRLPNGRTQYRDASGNTWEE